MTTRELLSLLLLGCLALVAGRAERVPSSLATQGFVIVDGDE